MRRADYHRAMPRDPAAKASQPRSSSEGEPPKELVADLAVLLELPPGAQERFWELLGPCLVEPLPRSAVARVERFAAAHTVDASIVGRALRAARTVVRRAALLDVPQDAFIADVARLGPAGRDVAPLLGAGFEAAKLQVRGDAVRRALTAHGSVLEGVDARVDLVMSYAPSEPSVKFPVGLLTLRYREGDRARRITLQATPDAIAELKAACERLLR
jgi:hypothetical protein